MTTDDRFDEIKRLLDSTISEFQSLFESAGGFEDSRVGNGWKPETVQEEVYLLQPKPIEELYRLANLRKRALFRHRLLSFIRPKDTEIDILGKPRLKLIPFWRVSGFHECFYFRGNSYKVDLPDDVVAVEVEGRIRDIVGQDAADSLKFASLTRRILGRREWSASKSLRLSDVTELAYMYKEGSMFLDSDGREDPEAEAFFEGKVPLERLTADSAAKNTEGAEVIPNTLSKDDLVRRLHSMVVHPPPTFTRILSNRFQVTQLARFLIPVYTFVFNWRGQHKELSVHGYTGGVFQ